MWQVFDNGSSINQAGSEGTIIKDEEHSLGARITLEENGVAAPFSITCGVYGLMVHTVFIGEFNEAEKQFEAIKIDMQSFLNSDIEDGNTVTRWCEQFVAKY